MTKFAEKLIILREHSEGLLERLYHIKKLIDEPKRRPLVLGQANMRTLFNSLEKTSPKFSDDIERVQGYEYIKQNLSSILEELSPIYSTFRAIYEWTNHAQAVLEEMATASNIDFDVELTLLTMTDYFTVLTNYVKMILLLMRVDQRILLLTLYNLVYTKVNGSGEASFMKVFQLFKDFSNPFDQFREKFLPIQMHAGKALLSLATAFDRGHITYLSNKRPLEMLSEPDRIPYPSIEDTYIYITLHEQMNEWIAYTYICCPEALGMSPNPVAKQNTSTSLLSRLTSRTETKEVRAYELLLMKILENNYLIRLYGDEYLFIHEPYDEIVRKIKTPTINLKKEKKSLENAENLAAQNSQESHMQKRLYLLLQLRNLLNMMKDSPGLLGPKFQLILATLSLSRMEILWYFRHLGVQPKFAVKKFKDVKDPNIAEMIYLIDELMTVCLNHKEVIQNYYKTILQNMYCRKVNDLVEVNRKRFEGQLAVIVDSIIQDLSGSTRDFRAMRMNWKRLETYLAGFQFKNALQEPSIRDLFATMTKVYLFSLHVDDIETELAHLASLKELYYYHKQVYDMYRNGLEGELRQPLFIIAFIRILDYYPDNIHKTLNPELRREVGNQAVELANDMLETLAITIQTKLDELRGDKGHNFLSKQLGGDEAAELFKFYMLKDQYKDKEKIKDMEKRPGYESYHREREVIKGMRALEKNLTQLLFSLGKYQEIAIFDTVFYPTEYLRSKLESYIDSFVCNAALKVSPMPKDMKEKAKQVEFPPPSAILNELQSFMVTLKIVEQCVNVKTEDLVVNAFLKHFVNLKYIESPYHVDRQKMVPDNPIVTYARWYTDLISNANSKYKLLYSPIRKTFVSTEATPIISFKAEEYVDLLELTALATFVGPYGVRVIDQHLLDELNNQCEALRDVLVHHHNDLKEIEKTLYTEGITINLAKKFKSLDKLMDLFISIGGILVFRKNLHEALEDVVRRNIPIIYNVIHAAHKQYKENIFMDKKFLLIDEMATDCGMPVNNADSALKFKLSHLAENSSVWEIIPVAFAVLLASGSFWNCDYNPDIEAWNNNIHLSIECFNQLVVAIFTIKSNDIKTLEEIYDRFAENAAMILLNMRSLKSYADKHVDNCYIYADKLIKEADPFIKSSVFEELTPYSLLRSVYRHTYEVAAPNAAQ